MIEDKFPKSEGTFDMDFQVESLADLIRYCEGISGDLEERAKVLKLQAKQFEKDVSKDKLNMAYMELERMTTDATLFKMIGALADELKENDKEK